MREPEFIGEHRRQLVDELERAYLRSVDGSPAWISIEASSGWGKSRLAHEFYKRLAERYQDDGVYWPPSIAGAIEYEVDDGGADIELCRKRAYPESLVPAMGATPAWFWWGLGCHQRYGTPVQALVTDLGQFTRCKDDFERRWRLNVTLAARANRHLEKLLSDLKEEGAELAIEQAALRALSVIGLGPLAEAMGLFRTMGRWGMRTLKGALDDHEDNDDNERRTSSDITDQVATEIRNLAKSIVPVVIFVEDLHLADAELVRFLSRLLMPGARVLLITTSWPGELDNVRCSAHDLLDRCTDYVERWTSAKVLTPLDSHDRKVLAGILLPDAPESVHDALAEQYVNPLALRLATQTSALAHALSGRGDPLQVIGKLPREVENLYRAIWDGLPPKARELCMMAVLSTPKSVSADWGSGEDRWDRDVVIDAVARIEWLRDRLEKFGSTADDESHGWVRQVTDWLYRFHEPVQYRIALEAATDNHTDESLRQYRWEIAKKLDPTQENFERALHNATLLVALRAEGITEADEAWRAGILLIVETLASFPDVESARSLISHASELIDSVSEDPSSILRARRLRASAYSAIGDIAKAIAQFQEVLVDQIDLLGPEHPETLETHNDLAVAIRKNGEPERALELHRDIFLIRSRTLNPDHPKVLLTRNNIGRCLSEIGSHEDALNEFRNLYDDKIRLLGTHDESTLITRGNLAVALRKSGQLEDAVVEFRELLEDRKRLLGDDHPSTLVTRGNLAHALRVGGRFDEAISEYEALLRDRRRVLGVDHPKTLLTHHNLAVAFLKSGRAVDAIQELSQVVVERTRALGPAHPDTGKSRNLLERLLDSNDDN